MYIAGTYLSSISLWTQLVPDMSTNRFSLSVCLAVVEIHTPTDVDGCGCLREKRKEVHHGLSYESRDYMKDRSPPDRSHILQNLRVYDYVEYNVLMSYMPIWDNFETCLCK